MYHPEPYWNEVAKRISRREKAKIIAGDDEPYYIYKREKFLKLFDKIDFQNKKVLEVGSGPGGNLFEILKKQPKELHGVDISDEMVNLSKNILNGKKVTINKIDGQNLPYPNDYFDLTFTSTVLQHNTDELMLRRIINEIGRVTKTEIYIFERIEKTVKGTELCLGRPVNYYQSIFDKNDFELKEVKFLNIQISYLISGAIRKLFNKQSKKEGEPISEASTILQKISLPITSFLDRFFIVERELAMLHFIKIYDCQRMKDPGC